MKSLAVALAAALVSVTVVAERGTERDARRPLESAEPQQSQLPQPAPQQPPTTFRSSVDLVPVDVSVVDRDGRPVADLTATDFALTVDGKPRRIASAEFIAVRRDTESVPPPTDHSTNADAATGRLIMLLVDQGNIGSARGKFVIDAASKFVSQLNRSDRIALHTIPGAGPQVEFTSNHALVRTMLQNLVGQASAEHGRRRVGIAEAMQLERGEERLLGEIIERECPGFLEPAEVQKCSAELRRDARAIYLETRAATRDTLLSLRAIIDRLIQIPGAKSVILVSEGILLDRDYGDVAWLGPLAARAQVTLTVLQLEPPAFDAAANRISATRTADIDLAQEGLSYITGLARGTVIRVVNQADFAFNRLALELSGYYLLSFEPEPGDRDGKSHKIKVTVPGRRNVEMRARSEFAVNPVRTRSNDEILTETIRSPLLATEIGLGVSTYAFREADTEKLRIILATEVDRSRNEADKVSIAYVVADPKGTVVASQIEPDLAAPISVTSRKQPHVAAISVPSAGDYLVKVAVLDSAGRRGSVQHNFRASLTSAGQVRVSDLLIAENPGVAGASISPAVSANFTGQALHGYVELTSDSPEQLANASAVLEIASTDEGRAIDSAAATFQKNSTATLRVAEAAVPIALLSPGSYVARVVVSVSGKRAGQVTRPFRIARAAMTTTTSAVSESGRAPGTAPPIAFNSPVDKFDRASVLTPPVVGFFIDRMNIGNRVAPAPASAVAALKTGNYDAAIEALKSSPPDRLAAVFLTGVALYAKGELEAAANKFRESLRLDSEFFPAAFYLGACYAAGGRDRDAIGAWQTSLITESSAPFIYTLLADAMVRQKDYGAALDILNEATTLWPESDDVQMRLGSALALAGQSADALKVLDAYLSKHPSDHEPLFIAMRVIYDARAAGRSIGTAAEDRERFGKYAVAYAAAGGPQQNTVAQWKRLIDR